MFVNLEFGTKPAKQRCCSYIVALAVKIFYNTKVYDSLDSDICTQEVCLLPVVEF